MGCTPCHICPRQVAHCWLHVVCCISDNWCFLSHPYSTKPKEEAKELIIPLIETNRWYRPWKPSDQDQDQENGDAEAKDSPGRDKFTSAEQLPSVDSTTSAAVREILQGTSLSTVSDVVLVFLRSLNSHTLAVWSDLVGSLFSFFYYPKMYHLPMLCCCLKLSKTQVTSYLVILWTLKHLAYQKYLLRKFEKKYSTKCEILPLKQSKCFTQ